MVIFYSRLFHGSKPRATQDQDVQKLNHSNRVTPATARCNTKALAPLATMPTELLHEIKPLKSVLNYPGDAPPGRHTHGRGLQLLSAICMQLTHGRSQIILLVRMRKGRPPVTQHSASSSFITHHRRHRHQNRCHPRMRSGLRRYS